MVSLHVIQRAKGGSREEHGRQEAGSISDIDVFEDEYGFTHP
jgi:hypothetical protein